MTSTTAGLSSHRPVRERGWRDRAACRGTNSELFFPVGDDGPARRQIAEAKRVCANCPARAICLEEALSSGEDEGIFGGHTPTERRALKRHARNAARTPAGPEAIPATSTSTELARSDHVQVQRLIAAALAQQQDLPEVTSGEAALTALTLVTRHRWTPQHDRAATAGEHPHRHALDRAATGHPGDSTAALGPAEGRVASRRGPRCGGRGVTFPVSPHGVQPAPAPPHSRGRQCGAPTAVGAGVPAAARTRGVAVWVHAVRCPHRAVGLPTGCGWGAGRVVNLTGGEGARR
jgi:WhiB family redox-sensing transcriptional regulator